LPAARCLLALLLLCAAARAAPETGAYGRARALFQTGQQHFRLAEYGAALTDFAEAYRLVPQPALLYNIAQCHRELGHLEDALRFYRSYLATTRPDDPERPTIEARIGELEERVRANEASARAQEASARLALERDLERARTERVATEVRAGVRPRGTRAGARALKWSGAGALALGGALLAGGLGSALVAARARDDLEAAAARGAEFDPAIERRLDRSNVGAAVLFGAGAVVAGAGAVLLGVGLSRDRAWRQYEAR
jgi:tetratricopeptide (TPR) repeat protein